MQNTLSNFFAGVHIISDRPINVGDYIEMDGNIAGYVEDIGWRSTRIKTFEPFIRYHTFGDSNINFSIILRIEEFVDRYLVAHEFIKALKARYDKENIEISWPIRKIYTAKQ